MGRRPCCAKKGLNKGAWTAMEDKTLTEYIKLHGEGKWRNLPIKAGLNRCGKSCRLRWLNYLRPDIKRGNITRDEEDLIIRLHNLLGNRWSLIAGRLPGRTDNEIKNYWNSNISKKVPQETRSSSPSPSKPANHRRGRSQTKPSPASSFHCRRQQPPPAKPVHVVRTKATRCTRVVISKELQNLRRSSSGSDHEPTELAGNSSIDNNVALWGPIFDQSGPAWSTGKIQSSDMEIDRVDADEQLFSRVLESELSYFSNSEHDSQFDHRKLGGDLADLSYDHIWRADAGGDLDVDWIKSFLESDLDQI